MNHCKKCGTSMGVLVLVVGVLFLLQDLGTWDFWGISWYTALFVLVGISMLGCGACGDCGCKPKGKKGKK